VVLAKFEEDGTVWVRIVRGDKLDRDSWNIDTGLLAPPETKTLPPVLVTSHAVKKEGPVNMEDKLHLLRTSRVRGGLTDVSQSLCIYPNTHFCR
jgi:hypothetical protein